MKTRETTPGRTYSVHTMKGCTIIAPDGWQKTIEAPDGYFDAHFGSVVIEGDDEASIKELFKLAPIAFSGGGKPGWYDVLRSELAELLGAGNFSLTYAWVEDKFTLTLALPLEITDDQMAQVRVLLGSIPPRNLVTEMEWADGLPIDYTHVEYLENVIGGDSDSASVRTGIYPTQNTRGKLVADAVMTPYNHTYYAFGCSYQPNAAQPFGCSWWNRKSTGNYANFSINETYTAVGAKGMSAGIHTLEFGKDGFSVDGVLKGTFSNVGEFTSPHKLMFLSEAPNYVNVRCFRGKAYSFKLWENDVPILDFVPALDPTGAPCFFDTVTKKPYYSVTAWDFSYPGAEEAPAATTYSLRAPRPYRPEYAKDTGRGIARLYRLPAGYEGSIEEYAAAHGYKWLVENEQPADGDWQPVWRETEEQLILDWVETEARTEEETFNQPE